MPNIKRSIHLIGLLILIAVIALILSFRLLASGPDPTQPYPHRPAHCARIDQERVYGPYGHSELVCRVNAPELF